LVNLTDEAVCDVRLVATGAKRVAPLSVRKTTDERTGPSDVFGSDAPMEQFLMPTVIVERDETVRDAGNESIALEEAGIVPSRCETTCLAESGPEIADDIPAWGVGVR
jgi:hypothetical protein